MLAKDLLVGLFFIVVIPFEVGFSVLGTRFDEFLLFRVGDVEVDGTDAEGVDVNRALPVVTVQMHIVLEVDER